MFYEGKQVIQTNLKSAPFAAFCHVWGGNTFRNDEKCFHAFKRYLSHLCEISLRPVGVQPNAALQQRHPVNCDK